MDSFNAKPRRLIVGDAPAISPDGKLIVYCERLGPSWGQIQIIQTDGNNRKQLTHLKHEGACSPRWSPDGLKISITGFSDNNHTIYAMDADGENVTSIASGDNPKWSPDGKRILFTRWARGADSALWIVNADGSDPKKVINIDSRNKVNPTWFPDGQSIIFEQRLNDRSALYQVNIDGTDLHLFQANDRLDLFSPIFSPDGKFLVVDTISKVASSQAILLIDLAGHQARPLAYGSHASVVWNKQ